MRPLFLLSLLTLFWVAPASRAQTTVVEKGRPRARIVVAGSEPEYRAALTRKLNTFERYVTTLGVEALNERNNSPREYSRLYRERYLPRENGNKALGAKIEWIAAPAERYRASGEKTLLDGLYGGASFTDSWTGWEGMDGALVVDLGWQAEFETVETDFLHQLGAWVLLPRSVSCSVSADGATWTPMGRSELSEDSSVPVKFVQAAVTAPQHVRARYVKVEIGGTKTCPSWHYGVGCPSWFFLDEVTVR